MRASKEPFGRNSRQLQAFHRCYTFGTGDTRDWTPRAIAIRQEVTKQTGTNSIATRRDLRVRRRDPSLKYHEDCGFADFPPERIEEDISDWSHRERRQDTVLKALEEYKSLVSALGTKASRLESLARAVSFASFRGLHDKELAERVVPLGVNSMANHFR